MPSSGFKNHKRKLMVFCLMAVGGLTLFPFQNFDRVSFDALKPRIFVAQARVLNPHDGSTDIRDFAPVRPRELDEESPWNAPESSRDPEEWLRKQAHYLTGGADEKIVRQLNRGLERLMSYESRDDAGRTGGHTETGLLTREPSSDHHESRFGLLPKSMKFTSINRLEMDFGSQTHLTCSFEGANVRWDIVRPLSEKFDMKIRHESADSKSSLLLNYNW